MDLENDELGPEDMQFEEKKESVVDKKKLMIEKTKKLQLKLEANSEPPVLPVREKTPRSSKLSMLRD